MKKIGISIKYRIFLLFTISMIGILSVSAYLTRIVSSNVLENTLSEYLISAVNSNTDKMHFQSTQPTKSDAVSLKYNDGYIVLDKAFLSILNDVESGLYTSKGKLLYGGDKALSKINNIPFTYSRIYTKKINNQKYIVYDRQIKSRKLEELWIRGIVPLTNNTNQLNQITKNMITFLPLYALIIILGSIIASYSILKPIRKMKATASEIMNGDDLNKRIPTSKTRDEINDLAEAYNNMFNRLEESFNREKQFTSDASHELRTPLSVITNQIEYSLEHEELDEFEKESFQVIYRQSKRMNKLIDDMLGLSRLSSGTDRYSKEDINLSELTTEVCNDMALIKFNDISIDTDIEKDIHILGNKQLLERMLINLIDNSYKYGKPNGKTTISLKESSNNITLIVKDNGIGIEKENINQIFDRFYREDSSRTKSNGYGLGLSLVAEITKYHNATIEVESTKGNGSTFIIKLNS